MASHRRIRLDWCEDTRARWQPLKPEFAAAVNALSLGMPSGEPYVMRGVRDAAAHVDDPELAAQVSSYLAQEGEHTRQHRAFNEILIAQHPTLRFVERWLESSYGFLQKRMSRKFALAYAAGFEATAFAAARWMDRRRRELFTGADTAASTLILWHLAEEVEHKSVAHDVWAAVDGNRLRYVAAMSVCFAMLVWFIFLGTVVQLAAWKRIVNPVAWFRLVKWGFGFAFEVMPTIAITATRSHHPSNQADPAWMVEWLATYDAETNTMPAWDAPIDEYVRLPIPA